MRIRKKAIIFHLLGSSPEVAKFLFATPAGEQLRDEPDALLFDSWELETEQRLLVGAALDIWSSKGNVFLWELLQGLSSQNLSRLIRALECWRDSKALQASKRRHALAQVR